MAESLCPVCQGTGWVLKESGPAHVAKRCKCYTDRLSKTLMDHANIPKRYQNCTLKNFEIHNDSHRDALKISKKFLSDYPELNCGLFFIGPCGVGKTHLAVAIIQELIQKKSILCSFYDFRELIREIQSTFTPESSLTESDILAPVFQNDVIVLDELGAKRTTAWVEETIFYIINFRYNHKKITIFTSNYMDTEEEEDKRDPYYKKMSESFKKGDEPLVDRIGVRLRSRIYEMCKIIAMEGEDYRKKLKQAGYRF